MFGFSFRRILIAWFCLAVCSTFQNFSPRRAEAQQYTSLPHAGAVRVAIYDDSGSPRTPRDMQRVLGGDPSHFIYRFLSAEEIRSGDLAPFEVLVQGGGDSLVQSRELDEKGREAIREFIRKGGGYVGICGGAHFAVPGDKLKLGILNAKVVDNEHWARGRGNVILDFTPEGQKQLAESGSKITVMYHQGPLLEPGDRTDLPPYTLLASYETEVAKKGAPHGVMQGTGAIVSSHYGEGRILVFSPHPEQTDGQEGLVRQALFWAAGRTDQFSTSHINSDTTHPSAVTPNHTADAAANSELKSAEASGHLPLQQTVSHPVSGDFGCCGPITPKANALLHYLDSLDVDHLWRQHTFVNWETGQPTPSNGHREPKTHCSAFAAAAAERLNIYMMRPPEHKQSELAAAQERYFESSRGRKDGWTRLRTPQEAQTLANQGEFVVLVYGNPNPHKSGHIAIVRPAIKSLQTLNDEGPQTTQAGGHNFSSGTAQYSFIFHPGVWPNKVEMFAHAINFDIPQAQPHSHNSSEDSEDE